jgi:crotonobetainyl-CoA:carnitine CoA-transferase CaiB-like acyl-CoA transferase
VGRPLSGVRVLDFSTLLPGPLVTLLLAEAGADVLKKVERPGVGDEMRAYTRGSARAARTSPCSTAAPDDPQR